MQSEKKNNVFWRVYWNTGSLEKISDFIFAWQHVLTIRGICMLSVGNGEDPQSIKR